MMLEKLRFFCLGFSIRKWLTKIIIKIVWEKLSNAFLSGKSQLILIGSICFSKNLKSKPERQRSGLNGGPGAGCPAFGRTPLAVSAFRHRHEHFCKKKWWNFFGKFVCRPETWLQNETSTGKLIFLSRLNSLNEISYIPLNSA